MEPENYIVQIQDSYLAQFIFYWIQHDKPCSLLFIKAHADNLTGIKTVIDTLEAKVFLENVKQATGCKLHKIKR